MEVLTDEPKVDSLIDAVRCLDKAFGIWEKSTDEDEFSPNLLSAAAAVAAIVTTGFPKDDRLVQLYLASAKLAGALQDVYLEVEGSPRRLLAEIEAVISHLNAVEVETEAPAVSVKALLEEFRGQPQRYMWIAKQFGEYDPDKDLWSGPFFSKTGVPRGDLIEKEGQSPGSVLGEDYKPISARLKAERVRAAAIKQVANLQAGLFRPEGGAVKERATVLELLQEGQYPDVIARVKGVPLNDVLRTAAEHGVRVKTREEDLQSAYQGKDSPSALPVDDGFPDDDDGQPFDVDTTMDDLGGEEFDPDSIPAQPVEATTEELTEFAAAYLDDTPDATTQDILAALVKSTGKTSSGRKLGAIVKKLKGGA